MRFILECAGPCGMYWRVLLPCCAGVCQRVLMLRLHENTKQPVHEACVRFVSYSGHLALTWKYGERGKHALFPGPTDIFLSATVCVSTALLHASMGHSLSMS